MTQLWQLYNRIDVQLTRWMARHGIDLLRISIGIVFFWFGFLKFFPGLSPAQDLAINTIDLLTFGLVPPVVAIYVLATWETIIGLGLIFKKYLRLTLLLLFAQMVGTVTPLALFPHDVFTAFPYGLTLEGQYIVKNIVLVSGALVVGATVRGGRLDADAAAE